MRLLDLNPRWYDALQRDNDGTRNIERAGLTFDCPCCREMRLAVATHPHGVCLDPDPDNPRSMPAGQHVWAMTGSGFDDLTLAPSVDASGFGHWHGFITNGEIL